MAGAIPKTLEKPQFHLRRPPPRSVVCNNIRKPIPWKDAKNAVIYPNPELHAFFMRELYKRSEGDYAALPPAQAEEQGLADKVVDAYSFLPMRVTADNTEDGLIRVNMQLRPTEPNGFVFQGSAANYDQILTACLRNLFVDFGR